jgi:hypothetical protein
VPDDEEEKIRQALAATLQASLASLIGRKITPGLGEEVKKRLKAHLTILDELVEHEEEDF